ncbi:uncharacterized protein CC84DRAFT_1220792 [Paraphaeosphaeria sporulosa]|uniref:C6 zinc finger domain-containing protein n=1 Tax=Paraphaeosphaeria sporulosa TaxID=1460663 RepID=A0A177C6V8_9PLEO|nr:uncharacterized protein CC84DRAFT_1220792 [Paraphaeosphaeria sporulosa]OAG02477.1 hypothetical protein CC84DRAFT_1220792 [Paraphaeosphaeria sporulosa]
MPHCLMCTRFKRQCPGPTDAPLLFVDTSSYPSGKKPRAKKPSPQVTSLEVARRFEDGRGIAVGVGSLPDEMAFVLQVDVSPRYVLGEAFFQNLTAFMCAEGRHMPGAVRRTPSWLHALPRMAAAPPPSASQGSLATHRNEALSLALRATTAAFSSLELRNDALLHHAYGLYGGSLRTQGRVLQEKGDKAGDLYMIMTSLMLTLFESVVASSGEGFALHNVACAKMIDNALEQASKAQVDKKGKGPGGGEPGPMLINAFFHVRIQLCFVYLTTSNSRIRDDPVMKRVLLEACGWTQERLPLNMQIITPLAKLMELQSISREATSSVGLEREREKYTNAREEVNQLWNGYRQQSKGQRLCWTSPGTGHTDFRDPFTALTYAYFSACHILLGLLAPTYDAPVGHSTASLPFMPPQRSKSISSSSSTSSNSSPTWHSPDTPPSSSPPLKDFDPSFPPPSMTDHFALILSVSWYLRLRDTGFAYLRLHNPLFLVAMYAPTLQHRNLARMVFEDWKIGALRGIGWLAIAKLDKEQRAIESYGP